MNHRKLMGLVLLGVAIGAAGCGSPQTASQNPSQSTSTRTEQNASLRRSIDLVGIWLGHAMLDRDALQKHLAELTDPEERARIEQTARSFESVSVAMEFRADSTLEVEVEILPPDSPPIRENTLGTWKVIASDANSITVHCTENYDGGRVEEETLRYEIAGDKDHITTVVPVGDDLRPFNPRFEFERRDEAKLAEQPEEPETTVR